ncbi:TraR/DksA family transcriptional regulator [Ovoidimarina sediminis]|uniref:TraR/DksA family transcriptional regulator n=1 Tax=Ovoidimarina sediminis TaxID=3079856 RepID=UPI002911A55A|nr:TraR/DksA C4-type zinc finger protein [Rhodophyticola sp. MJ-SS7]MDU8945701.1 TraR/DksA C4-type zinc finger protein [Rhodophyticola sp. MJ-SS7]
MIDDDIIATYRARLEALLETLEAEDAAGAEDQATVTLDQQSVGRLSRMDAMQRQAMAQANARRRMALRQRIMAALLRMDEGEFGYCTDCGDEIAPGRLDADPTHPMCVSCASG